MSKRIVVCCDGTGNSFDRPETDSNVAKLYSCLTVDRDQRGYYHPGVGTMGAPTSHNVLEREWSRIKGLAFGAGLMANVADAYRYLMDTYEDGDEIFLFGFSRGAYTARVLASVLHVFGLLCAGNHELIPYILDMYSRRSREAKHKKQTFQSDEAFKWQFSHSEPVRIKFCGLWDTVSSYGWVYDPVQLPFLGRNPIIDIGRHAVSIHERRCFYQDNLWGHPYPGQDIRQVWFSGVHSDVGGSYPEEESGLSKITLEWMAREAAAAGLLFQQEQIGQGDGPAERYRNRWPAALCEAGQERLPAPVSAGFLVGARISAASGSAPGSRLVHPHGKKRTIPAGSWIHDSVLTSRWKPEHLPPHQVEPWPGKVYQADTPAPLGKDCVQPRSNQAAQGGAAKGLALAAAGAVTVGPSAVAQLKISREAISLRTVARSKRSSPPKPEPIPSIW